MEPGQSERSDVRENDDPSDAVSADPPGDATRRCDDLPAVYDQLRQMAGEWFKDQPHDHILQPTALVHEAFLKLQKQNDRTWRNDRHFINVAARAMRQILIDSARQQRSSKRGGRWRRVALADMVEARLDSHVDLLALDEALTELSRLSERQGRIVELRFLVGLTIDETATALGISVETVKLDWRMARAWLLDRLGQEDSKQ